MMHNHKMVALFQSLLGALRSNLRIRADLALENLALRQQFANLRRALACPCAQQRPRLRPSPSAQDRPPDGFG